MASRWFGGVSGAALAAGLLAGGAAQAATEDWTGATSTDWFTGTNWSPASVPTSATPVTINANPGGPTVIGSAGATSGQVTLGALAGQSGALVINGGALTTNGANFFVGDFGSGNLTIQAGGTLNSGISSVANNGGSTGFATVTGAGSRWTTGSFFDVGSSGNGTLNVLAGGNVSTVIFSIGNDAQAHGHVLISGNGSTLTASVSTTIAAAAGVGTGDVTVSNGGTLNGASITVGNGGAQASLAADTGATVKGSSMTVGGATAGSASFDGNTTVGNLSGTLTVGQSAAGNLSIANGAQVTSQIGTLGTNASGSGLATVTGAGSKWTTTSVLTVGSSGTGNLTASNGASIVANSMTVGSAAAGSVNVLSGATLSANNLTTNRTATIQVDGAGSKLSILNGVNFKPTTGTSAISVTNGGNLSTGCTTISAGAGATASATVSGASSSWTPSALFVGGNGTSAVTIGSGAVVVDLGDLMVDGNGTSSLTVSGGANVTQGNGPVGNNAGTGTFYIGESGKGSLTVDSGGLLSTRFSLVGDNAGATGSVTVTGPGSTWLVRSGASIGFSGSGSVTISNGGNLTLTGQNGITFGFHNGAVGNLTITGPGSKLTVQASATIGNSGTGHALISNGGAMSVGATTFISSVFIGLPPQTDTPGDGDMTVTGSGSTLATNGLQVGAAGGNGSLSVLSGANVLASGTVHFGAGFILNTGSGNIPYNGNGTGLVDGAGSLLQGNNTLDVGESGIGHLTVSNGGNVAIKTDTYIGSFKSATANGVGDVTVTGAGSVLSSGGTLRVGDQGTGALRVLAGGVVKDNVGIIGASSTGNGAALVDGAGSQWTTTGNLTVGQSSVGVLTVSNGASVTAGNVSIGRNASGQGVLNIGAAAGNVAVAPGSITATAVAFGAGSGQVVFNHTSSGLTFATPIIGAGSVSQVAGVTILSGTNTYSGATSVNGGTLRVTGSLASPTVDVASGATLGGTGSLAGNIAVANGGILQGAAGSVLTLGQLQLNDTSNLNVALGAPSNTALFHVNSNLTLDGRLNVTDAGGFALGTYRLIDYVGALTNNGLVIASLPTGFNPGNFDIDTTTTGQVSLIVRVGPNIQYWDGANTAPGSVANGRGGDGVWNLGNTNWTNQAGTINAAWASGSAVFAGQGGNVSVQGAINVAGLTFMSDGYVISTGAGGSLTFTGGPTPVQVDPGLTATIQSAIGGAGGLAKTGSGTLALSGTNTYTGGTSVTAGVLKASSEANLGNATGALTLDGGTFRFGAGFTMNRLVTLGPGNGVFDTNGQSATVAGAVSGAGSLTKTGAGTLILSGVNSYAGGTLVNAGTLQAAADANLGNVSGGVTLDAGTLRYGVGFASARSVTLGGGGGTVDTNGFDATLSGIVGGAGRLAKIGAGTLTLSGTNSYQGGTLVTGGAVAAGADANLGNVSGGLTLDGGTLRYAAGFATGRAVTLGAANGTFDTNGFSGSLNGVVSGAGRLTKIGAGTLTLSGTNTYQGGTLVSGGALQVSADANLGAAAGGLTLDGGALRYGAGFSSARAVGLGAGGGTFDTNGFNAALSGIVSGGGLLTKTGTGTLILSGANTWTGGARVNAGVLQGSSSSLRGDIADFASVIFDQATDGTYAGVLSGAGTFGKQGAGMLILTGNSGGFTGASTVSAGTLRVDGALGGPITVGAGARLQGVGAVGPATVAGTIAPGDSIGTLTVNGNYVQQAGSTFEAEIDPSGAGDKLTVTGSATLQGGTVNAILAPGSYTPNTHYTILTAAGGVNGQFAGLTQNMTFVVLSANYTANSVFLNVERNAVSFASVAATDNQKGVAAALDTLGLGTQVSSAAALLTPGAARGAFDALSGEIHADVQAQFLEDSRFVREAIAGRVQTARDERYGLWAEGFGASGHRDGDAGSAWQGRNIGGGFFGGDVALGPNWRAGATVGFAHANLKAPDRASQGSYDDTTAAGYVAGGYDRLRFLAGGAYHWQRVTTSRAVSFPGFSDSDGARYNATTGQVFGEVSYGFRLDRFELTPFASGAYVRARTDGFSEAGGGAALTAGEQSVQVTYANFGARAGVDVGEAVRLEGSLAWRYAGGDRAQADLLRLRVGGTAFGVFGAPIAQSAVAAQAGVVVRLGHFGRAYLGYSGVMGDGVSDQGGRGGVTLTF